MNTIILICGQLFFAGQGLFTPDPRAAKTFTSDSEALGAATELRERFGVNVGFRKVTHRL